MWVGEINLTGTRTWFLQTTINKECTYMNCIHIEHSLHVDLFSRVEMSDDWRLTNDEYDNMTTRQRQTRLVNYDLWI